MASLWKQDRSPFYTACITAVVGQSRKQLKKSTATEDRKLAARIADELEETAQGRRTSDQAKAFLSTVTDLRARRATQRAFDDVLRETTGVGLETKTATGFITTWLERVKGETAPATWAKYDKTARVFLDSLGGKADQDMASIRQDDIARFRAEQAKRVSASTANNLLKVVRVIFSAAEADGVIQKNEARLVKTLKSRGQKTARRAFTLPELKRILAACDDEWRSLVLLGFYTGARLGDLAALTWQNLDLAGRELRYVSRKTGRACVVPLSAPLVEHIEKLPAGDDPKQPLHPRAFEIVSREGRSGTLSNHFHAVLADAGLVEPRGRPDPKRYKGKAGRRVVSDIGFHALRHTAVSLLKSAGVSDAVARDVVGHESEAVSRLYTHIEDRAKREAVNKLPVIG